MAKEKAPMDREVLASLCTHFMQSANTESGGKLFRSWPHYNRDGELAIERAQQFLRDHFQTLFPSGEAQDNVVRNAVANAGVNVDNLHRPTLRKEGLDTLATLAGRVHRQNP